MSGGERRAVLRGYLAFAVLVFIVDAVNALSILRDSARMGRSLPAWQPVLWEYSSGLAGLAVAGVIYVAIRLAPLETKRWPRRLLVHIAASLVFSILHVVGMRLLRAGVYAAMGLHYGAWPLDLAYEYPRTWCST